MPSMSRLLAGLGQSIGALLGVGFVALQLGLFVGGISYRKDCVNEQGRIAKTWDFTWFAPIPYLFRPDDPGCEVHTGTRVALNAVGIAKFEETTATRIAEKAVQRTGSDAGDGYWIKLRGALDDYRGRNERVVDVDEGLRSIQTLLGRLDELDAPPQYAASHAALVSALDQAKAHGESMRAAARTGDLESFDRARKLTTPDAKRVHRAVERLNLAHASS